MQLPNECMQLVRNSSPSLLSLPTHPSHSLARATVNPDTSILLYVRVLANTALPRHRAPPLIRDVGRPSKVAGCTGGFEETQGGPQGTITACHSLAIMFHPSNNNPIHSFTQRGSHERKPPMAHTFPLCPSPLNPCHITPTTTALCT